MPYTKTLKSASFKHVVI